LRSARRVRLACTFSTRPSLIGTSKPTIRSEGFQEFRVKNYANCGTNGPNNS
jgi:hypothetical protein